MRFGVASAAFAVGLGGLMDTAFGVRDGSAPRPDRGPIVHFESPTPLSKRAARRARGKAKENRK